MLIIFELFFFSIFKNVAEVLLPVGWFEKKVGLDDDTLQLLSLIWQLTHWLTAFMLIFITCGMVFILSSIYIAWNVYKRVILKLISYSFHSEKKSLLFKAKKTRIYVQ